MNKNDDHRGRRVVITHTSHRRFAQDFPGWNAPNYGAFILPIPDGFAGIIRDVESHGAAPYTRYTVRFDDGSYASGLNPSVLRFAS